MNSLDDVLRDLMLVADHVGPELCRELLFVGGSILPLLVRQQSIRPTEDVDCVLSATTLARYYELTDRLKQQGFRESMTAGIICRYVVGDRHEVQVDFMPMVDTPVGPTNPWYVGAWTHAIEYELPRRQTIRVVSPVYFLATKMEAYRGRGQARPEDSHDLEDMLALVMGRADLAQALAGAETAVKVFIETELRTLLELPGLDSILLFHLPQERADASGVVALRRLLQSLAGLD